MDCGWRLSAVRILGFSGRNCRTGGRRTATSFCPRRATEGRGERQHLFVHGGPRRGAENGNIFLSTEGHGGARRTATSFCPRRATEGRGERQHLFVHGGPRRGAENGNTFLSTEGHEGPPFCPRRPRRGAENGNIFLSTEGHGGARRTATPFCPRRATEGRGERQHLFVHEGPRRGAKNGNIFLSTEGHGGARRTATPFCPRRATEGAENGNTFLSTEGHGGARRTATFCPRRATKGREERQHLSFREGTRRGAKNIDGSCPTEGRRVLKRAPTRGAPTGGVWGIWESTPGAREGRHKACPYGGGAVLPRFFCFLGVGSVWGKMFLLLRSILIYWRKQRVHIV